MNIVKTSIHLIAALAAVIAAFPSAAQEDDFITVVSWGGSYARASVKAYHDRFVEETGIRIKLDEYNGGLAQVRAQAETGNVSWDVVDMEAGDTLLGCDEGLLETIDYETLPAAPDGTPATEDFLDVFDVDCGAKNVIYSTVYAYNDTLFPNLKPATMADFFDLGKFPGRRGMRRTPNANLEFALVADGVPGDQVYTVLSSEEGIARAFRKLGHYQEPGGLVGSGRTTAADAGRRRGRHEHRLQRAYFQCLGPGKTAADHRLGRPVAVFRATRLSLPAHPSWTWPGSLSRSQPAPRPWPI